MIHTENFEPGTSLANVIGEGRSSTHCDEIIQSIRSNTDSERQSLNDLENSKSKGNDRRKELGFVFNVDKYKTELCRNYSTYGYCSYASRCQFAHGLEELRCRTRHPKYKTEFCRNFLSGFCKYGSRCQFLHHSINPIETSPSTQSYPTASKKTSFSSSFSFNLLIAAIGTYLLTNILAHSAALGLDESLAALLAATDSSLKHSTLPLTCSSEITPLHFPQSQNNNNFPCPRATLLHSQSSLSSARI